MSNKQAFGYIRVSSQRQADEGISLDAQKARIEAYCAAENLKLVQTFVDAGISGGRADNRPSLQKALNAACNAGGILIVYSLSRLARSVKDTIAIAERLEKSSADLVSISEQLCTTSAAGKMIFRLLSVMSEFEKDLVSERTKMALNHLQSQNCRVSHLLPFGFKSAPDGIHLERDEKEQIVLARLKAMVAENYTYSTISRIFNEESVPTKYGGKWHAMSVSRIARRA